MAEKMGTGAKVAIGLGVAGVVLYLVTRAKAPRPLECIPYAEKLEATRDYFAGLITRAELDSILAIPTCLR